MVEYELRPSNGRPGIADMYAVEESDVRARISMDFGVEPMAVFEAWILPPLMERWLFKSPANRLEARAAVSAMR